MGPKSKVLKNGWDICNVCNVCVAAVDTASHMDHYHGNSKQPEVAAAQNLDTTSPVKTPKKYSTERLSSLGFIRDGILHGFGVQRRIKGDELSRLPASAVDDIVIVNPSTMTVCRMSIGSQVLVWCSPMKFALQTAWPASKAGFSQTEVSLSPRTMSILSCECGSQVHVQNFEPAKILPASQVTLESSVEKSFFGTKEFSDSFRHTFDGKNVLNGSSLITHFYGQKCELKVFSINNVSHEHSQLTNDDDNTSTLCEDMAELSVSLDQDDAKIESDSSKPPSLCVCHKSRPSVDTCFYIHSETRVRMRTSRSEDEAQNADESKSRTVTTFDDIGGLTKQIDEIRRFIDMSKSDAQNFFSYGLQPPKGMVLYGPSGTGKTLIGRAIEHEMQDRFLSINGPEVYSKFLGETESNLRELFAEGRERAPCVIFIDEIDTLCARRTSSSTQPEQRVVATLTNLMDNLPTFFKERVVVVAATSKLDDLDPAMRRPGRFDKEIEIGIPSVPDRQQILSLILKPARHNLSAKEIEKVAAITHGFVGADLTALLSEAGMRAMRRLERGGVESSVDFLTYEDVLSAASVIKPSALREILFEVPKVKWEDIGGQDDLKLKLKQAVEWPLKYPESFKRMGITPPKGVLMYGPPGCSKTLIAKAVATESGLNFIAIKGPELFSKWVGESEKAIREVFRKARAAAPSVVFFDEIDALASERGNSSGGSQVGDRVLAQLLSEMDGLVNLQGVFILAATNRPDMIDKALLRPGRLDRIVYVPLPDRTTRHDIFRIRFKRMPVADDVDLDDLADKTDNYSGAEVVAVCQEAALGAMEESLEAMHVCRRHFDHALGVVKPRISEKMIRFYEEYSTRGQQNKSDL